MLSKIPKEGYHERLERFADWRTLVVKFADRIHNLRRLEGTDLAFQEKQIDETRRLYLPLVDRLMEIIPRKHRRGALRIRDLLATAFTERRLALEAALWAAREGEAATVAIESPLPEEAP